MSECLSYAVTSFPNNSQCSSNQTSEEQISASKSAIGGTKDAAERTRLRRNDHQSVCGDCNCNILGSNPSRNRQYGLPEFNEPSGVTRKKKTLIAKMSQLFGRVSKFCQECYHQSNNMLIDDRKESSNTVAINGSSALPAESPVRRADLDAQLAEADMSWSEWPAPSPVSQLTMHPTATNNGAGNKAPSRLTRAAFCPCFSPNVSDDEDSGSELTEMGEVVRHRGELANRQQVLQRDGACRQILSVARDFRSRLAFAADSSAQQPGPSGIRRIPQGVVPSVEPYIVHTSIDYTNCLVPALDKITAAPYYWGVMDRYEAEALLDNKPEGTFLLRDSAQSEYLFSVSFRRYKRTLHARIEQKNHRFSFDFSDPSIFSADTITELIAYYKDPAKCLFFEPQLSIPLPRNFVFSLQHLCRACVASLTTYSGVDKLNLPTALKQFVQEYYYKHPVKTVNHVPRAEENNHARVSTEMRPYRSGLS